ncbi:MAG: hypothetical protein Q9M28_10100 [Mariprofundaceae bacterium]|nr:hypothetical protein [Mariprofundaceae bacterium]
MKEGEIAPHEANDRRFIARIPKKTQQNYILIKNLYVKEYCSDGYYRGRVNYFTKIRVRVLNKWFEQDDRALKLLSLKAKKTTSSKAVKAFAAQQKAGKENGVKAYAYKEPFIAEYRQERNRNGTRKDDVTKLRKNYPKAKTSTLMEYAKEADHEDEFPRPRGRKKKKE